MTAVTGQTRRIATTTGDQQLQHQYRTMAMNPRIQAMAMAMNPRIQAMAMAMNPRIQALAMVPRTMAMAIIKNNIQISNHKPIFKLREGVRK